jgi:hypothetical protein
MFLIRVTNKISRSTENERVWFGAEGEAGFCSALSMEPDAARNEISRLNAESFF